MDDINWKHLFKQQTEHISWLKSEYIRQQKQMTQKAQILFSAQRVTPGQNDDDLKFNSPVHKIDFYDVPLRNDIPIISWMGPSKCGKSTLLNDILGVKDAFKVSSSPNTQCTKGAWIARYNVLHQDGDDHAPDALLVDDEVISTAQCTMNKPYDKKTVDQLERFGYTRRQIICAMDMVEDSQDINSIIDCIDNQEEASHNDEIKHEMDDTLYEPYPQSQSWMTSGTKHAYMVDMEGLSHGVTPFTKKLFYACYAISNVIVWNDTQIGSDTFQKFMKDLDIDMKTVAQSERKPCLLYLQRDSDPNIDFAPYETLNEYIKNHESFEWLRQMKIFDSIHGFQLHRRPYNEPFDKDKIQPLVEFLLNLTFLCSRFVENAYDMQKQIDCINDKNTINLGLELIFANETLRGLLMKDGDGKDENIRRSQIIQYCERFNWDKNKIEEEFQRADDELLSGLVKQRLIDDGLRTELIQNKQDVIERINKKNTDDIIKVALIVTSPITVPLAIVVGLASAVVIVPYLAGSVIYDTFVASNEEETK